jgi:hypothetical protein
VTFARKLGTSLADAPHGLDVAQTGAGSGALSCRPMQLIALDVISGLLGAAGALALFAVVVRGWRLVRDPARARVGAVLRGRGLVPPPADDQELRATLRRCAQCTKTARCARALAEEDWTAWRGFCPNAGYFDSLRAR